MKIKSSWKKQTGIYCITNKLTKKCYVGSSINIYNRLMTHRSYLRSNIHANNHLQNSFNKHRENSFTFSVLELCKKDGLVSREQHWVSIKGHYNIRKDVERQTMSEESKLKMSITRKEKIANGSIIKQNTKKVKKYDLEGNFLKEYPTLTSASIENNISVSQIRRVLQGKHNHAKGYQWKYSEDTREVGKYKKRDYSNSLKKLHKKVFVFDVITKDSFIFNSYKEWANFFGVSHQTLVYNMNKSKKLYKDRYLFLGLSKQGELLGSPTTVRGDDQQPSLSSNILEGSTTNSRLQTDNAEESNANTSALPFKWIDYDNWVFHTTGKGKPPLKGDDIV